MGLRVADVAAEGLVQMPVGARHVVAEPKISPASLVSAMGGCRAQLRQLIRNNLDKLTLIG